MKCHWQNSSKQSIHREHSASMCRALQHSHLQMDNLNSIPGTIGCAENSPISSHQGFALLNIAPWREGKTRERGFPMTLHRWMDMSTVNIGSALKQGILQRSRFSKPFYASVSVAKDSCEQESLKDQDREWESKGTSRKKKTKCFLKINDNLNVWEIEFSRDK